MAPSVMVTTQVLTNHLETVFTPRQSRVLAEVITDAYSDLVKTSDFNELKAIVKDIALTQQRIAVAQERTEARVEELAAAQQRTEARVEELAIAQERLTAAQERTEARLEGLAAAQQRTEVNLAKLTRVVTEMSSEVGSVTQNMSYALENEAYRMLPALLARDHGIHLSQRLVRTEIEGVEINFFARGEREGRSICLTGEAKLRLDARNNRRWKTLLDQLDRQAQAVQQRYPDCEIVQLVVTHFAQPEILQKVRERGLVVVQSFEW